MTSNQKLDERWYDGAKVTKAEMAVALGKQRDEIERLRAELSEIASLPPPNPAKAIAARALCLPDKST